MPLREPVAGPEAGKVPKFSVFGDQIEKTQIPLVQPFKKWRSVLVKLHGQPDVGGFDGIGGRPAISHVDERAGLALHRQHECGLGAKGGLRLCIRADARVAEMGPRAEDGIGAGEAGAIGLPCGASGGNEEVFALMFEHRRRLIESTGEDADVFPNGFQVVIGELGDMERAVVLGGIEMIGFAVVIDEEIHVARHLAAFVMEAKQ